MKKLILLGSTLFAAVSVFSQTTKIKPGAAPLDLSTKLAQKYQHIESAPANNPAAPIGPVIPNENMRSSMIAPIIWHPISGSMNIFGMLSPETKPLQYNNELNAVSFIHRKSATYISSPVATPTEAASGVQVAMVTTDFGQHWDSTCIWNNNTQRGRFPTGGLYNPPGNLNIDNAYVVAGGPLTSAATSPLWIGNWMASKKLDVKFGLGYDNIASTVPGAQQFFPSTLPYNAVTGKFDFPTQFTSTDDGAVRMISRINTLAGGTTFPAIGYRGAKVVKGAFSSGVFNWTVDTIIPPNVIIHSTNFKLMDLDAHMAFNESGTVGYVVFIGTNSLATSPENKGLQPIVYQTTNSGASWSTITGIDFTLPQYKAPVMDHVPSVSNNTALTIPQFNTTEGVDIIVDKNDKLHIVSCLLGTFSSHNDSLNNTFAITHPDGERYNYGHRPGQRPYIYDFYQDVTGNWKVAVIDSMSSEGPGATTGSDGYNDNPWDADPSNNNTKRNSNSRIQLSRTPDGQFIVYTWAESDTNFTNSNHKWNHLPNLKARVMDVTTYSVHPKEIDMTNPITNANPLVASRAQMHYVSPKCQYHPLPSQGGPVLILPATVSNNQNTPLTQLQPNTHWYTSARLEFGSIIDDISENALHSIQNSVIYPNPASNNANLIIDLSDNSKLSIEVYNTVGQVVKTTSAQGHTGENTIAMDLNGIASGIYMVNVKAGNASNTKKLIIE